MKNWVNLIRKKGLINMKYVVEIIKKDVYIVEAENHEEAEAIAVAGNLPAFKADEVEEINVERAY